MSYAITDDELIQLNRESEINKMKCLIQVTKERITGWRQEIGDMIRNENCDPLQSKVLFNMFDNEEKKFLSYQGALSKLYEREIRLLNEEKVSKVLPKICKPKFDQEFRHLSESVNFGIREQQNPFDFHISDDTFEKMRVDFKNDCPLLSDVMQTLFITDDDDSMGKRKQLSFVHAMALLMNFKNKDLKSDVKLLFSILLLSYGVGHRLMNLLCRMKITYSWAFFSTFLDNFIGKKRKAC